MNESVVVLGKTVNQMAASAINTMRGLIRARSVLRLGFSGGKDSSVVLTLMLRAIELERDSWIEGLHHFVLSSSTTIENPALEKHLLRTLDAIRSWAASRALPIGVELVTPSLSAQFVVTTLGQGKLPRTPQNSRTSAGESVRPCSDSWKVQPQVKASKRIELEAAGFGGGEVITVLGTRLDESVVRGNAMRARGDSDTEVTRNARGELTLSPIANWTTDQVWEWLGLFSTVSAPFETYTRNGELLVKTRDLYRDANDGTCVVVLGDGGSKAPCGSRFGCAWCGIVGEADKSLSSMVANDKYAYLRGVSDFRDYLFTALKDMGKREVLGRTISGAGYVQLRPDNFSYSERMRQLRMILTLDAMERQRADTLSEDMESGLVPWSEEAEDMCEPQFEFINPEQLLAIDFYLGMHHMADSAFPALQAWWEVNALGRTMAIPSGLAQHTIAVAARESSRWVRVDDYDHLVPTDGLRNYSAELWNRYRSEQHAGYAQTPDGDRVSYFVESESLVVDPEKARDLLMTFPTMVIDARGLDAVEGVRFLLNEGIVRVGKGHIGSYHRMAKRGQYYRSLMETRNLDERDLRTLLERMSISGVEHAELLAQMEAEEGADLFSMLEPA
jgi:3'-phosphoadenosine 5'-phosphosulfate sulfotransferase (PAPS reductase)/FAD synthetase